MSTKRRIGVSAATTEAARRQLMQPVANWEKIWTTPTNAAVGSKLKIYKWVRTEKPQQFSDDEGEADAPLVPLPDEPELVEGDEEMEQDATEAPVIEAPSRVTQEPESELPSKAPSPKPQLLQTMPDAVLEEPADTLDQSLKPLSQDLNVDITDKINGDGIELDISHLGPDGLGLEGSHDLSQLEGEDAILGGPLMDETMDPFVEPMTEA